MGFMPFYAKSIDWGTFDINLIMTRHRNKTNIAYLFVIYYTFTIVPQILDQQMQIAS